LVKRKSDDNQGYKNKDVPTMNHNNLAKSLLLGKLDVPQINSVKGNTNNNKFSKKQIRGMYEQSKIGFAGYGQKKVNQDIFFIHKNFVNDPNSIYMGVCDGHGVNGHEVSGYLKQNLPKVMSNELVSKSSSQKFDRNKVIEDVFLYINSKIFNEVNLDTHFSGSTGVTVMYSPDKLICANVGDSRAVLGRFISGNWVSHNLTNDHKPNDKEELNRIKSRGGRVEPFRDDNGEFVGPARVWLKSEEIPGLAMSRSFGDQVAATVGVIAKPEITEWQFTPKDKFFIIASDGVWEFIESEECVNIIKDYYLKDDIQGATEFLVKESSKRWVQEEEVIDDITIIMVFLD